MTAPSSVLCCYYGWCTRTPDLAPEQYGDCEGSAANSSGHSTSPESEQQWVQYADSSFAQQHTLLARGAPSLESSSQVCGMLTSSRAIAELAFVFNVHTGMVCQGVWSRYCQLSSS